MKFHFSLFYQLVLSNRVQKSSSSNYLFNLKTCVLNIIQIENLQRLKKEKENKMSNNVQNRDIR